MSAIRKKSTTVDSDLELWLLMANTRHAMLQATQREFAPYHISPGQANVLRIIYNLGNKAALSEISRQVFLAVSTLSTRITTMEKKGFLKKHRDVPGTTLIRFEITPLGLEVYKATERRESMKKILSVLSREEQKQMSSCLSKLLSESLKFG